MFTSRTQSDNKSFASLVIAQGLGSFNDNFFKSFLIFFAMTTFGTTEREYVQLVIVISLLFIVPFIVFSAYAGWLADKLSKRSVVVWLKAVEIVLMAGALVGFYQGSFGYLLVVLSLMATQSAFFSPAKYGMLPEILATPALARGNGILELSNFLCIIVGTLLGGVCFEAFKPDLYLGGFVLVVVAALGWGASLFVGRIPAAAPGLVFRWNPFAELGAGLRVVYPDRTLWLTTLGVAYFWALASMVQLNLLFYGKEMLGLGEANIGYLQGAVAGGIGLGCALAGLVSRRKVELGLVPIGALGMALFGVCLFWTHRLGAGDWPFSLSLASLGCLGLSGGFFIIPLQAMLQQEAPNDKKGTVMAAANFFAFSGMLVALGIHWLLLGPLQFSSAQVFLILGAATIAGTVYVLTILPEQLFRFIFWLITNTIYRVRVVGAENLPLHGPALLVANHVSFIDGFLVLASTHRFIRFLVHKEFAHLPAFRWLSRVMKVIPIAAEDGPRAVIGALKEASAALEAGELVCIFAEGQISRTGQLLAFRSGTERIVKNFPAPIIPVHLDQVWGSIFSFSGRKFFWKLPLRLPYPVTVSFGKPMPAKTPIAEVRQSVQELGSAAFEFRKRHQIPLPWNFIRFARHHPLALAAVDSTGRTANFGKLAASVVHLARVLRQELAGEECAGLLVPPSVAGAAVNVAASLLGKVTVNLNYTASADAIKSALAQTKIRKVVTSRGFLEKVKIEVPAELVYLEDLASRHGRFIKYLDALAAWFLPLSFLRVWCGARRVDMDSVATIIFSSGSTGDPKGVLQSHFNILSNIQSVSQLLQLGPSERVLAILPFFHSTGYTSGLWAPLLTGMGAVYHPNPLDARTVGELARTHRVTLLFATPTFLGNYTRRCEPGDFGSVTCVIAGAEKLTPAIRDSFRERFGIEPMEGYGCTEAAPMISVNIPDFRGPGFFQLGSKRGTVGHPLPGVSVRVVDPDTGALLPVGSPGLLFARGPNIMRGYLDQPQLTAEVLKDGWYCTGDIALLDEDGFITITDRLSRFSKIAGEMVPHIRIEDAMNQSLGLVEPMFFVTALPDGKKGERLVVVHTASDEVLKQMLEKLPQQGLPNLWTPKQDAFVRVAEIPRLGTGKVDLKRVRQIAVGALG